MYWETKLDTFVQAVSNRMSRKIWVLAETHVGVVQLFVVQDANKGKLVTSFAK